MRKAAAAYQEQHKLSRGNVTVLYLQRGRNHLGDRHVRFYPDIVFKWDWTLCHVVISLHICNSSRCIDDSRLSKEVIGEQIKAPDSSTLEGRVREVGFETRRHDETEVRARWEARIWEGTEVDRGGWVRKDCPVCICQNVWTGQ